MGREACIARTEARTAVTHAGDYYYYYYYYYYYCYC